MVAGFLPFDHETSEKEIARQMVYEPTIFPNKLEERDFVMLLIQQNQEHKS